MRPTPVASPAQLCIFAEVLENYCLKNSIPEADPRRRLVSQRIDELFKTGMHKAEDLELILREIRL